METYQVLLAVVTATCGLVSGFLFAFAVAVMPGLNSLNDHDYLKAFRSIDRIIQNGQPLFMVAWVGSVVFLTGATVAGVWQLSGADLWVLVIATIVYIFGVMVPTGTINIPMNNAVQALDLESMDAAELKTARQTFEPRWNRWNSVRTALSTATTTLLIVLLLWI